MKLLFIHQNFGAFGGAESTLLLTASELRARGHQVGLLYSRSTGKSEEQWNAAFDGCVFSIAGKGNTEHVEAVLRDFAPDLLMVNSFDDLEILSHLLKTGLPIVRMVHDHGLYCMRQYRYNYFTRNICTRPASGFCVFPCLATVQRNHGPGLPVKLASFEAKLKELAINRRFQHWLVYSDYCREDLIRNGFDGSRISKYIPVPRARGDIPCSSFDESNTIIYVGQIIRGKGVDVLLKSLTKVRSRFQCIVLGDGNHRAYCEKLARKLGLAQKVQFKGFLPQDQIGHYYTRASAAVVSSVWPEPFGLVGPEAMRYGLPVVAFDAGGIKEWLHHNENGFLVPWMDVDAYAAAVERLLCDKTTARAMGAHGRELALRDYDLDLQVDHLENLLITASGLSPKSNNENAGINAVHGNC